MHTEDREAGNRVIRALSRAQEQTFFDGLKNDTEWHRTIASLGDQVAQAYRGRCVIELLQNGHDALPPPSPDDRQRITFVLTTSHDPCLLVANSGQSFRKEDVEAISHLAQSAKDPNHTIGNKGLGFRSVLEVSRRPAIWSTARSGAPAFAFHFDPDVLEVIAAAAQRLDAGDINVRSPLDPEAPLVDWSREQFARYQVRGRNRDVAAEVRARLSPYQFPLPLDSCPAEVRSLLDEGHVTVIRLPIDTGRPDERAGAIESLRTQLASIDAGAMVFLDRLGILRIDVDGERRTLQRRVRTESSVGAGVACIVSVSTIHQTAGAVTRGEREFYVWSRAIGGPDDGAGGAAIRRVVAHLPGRWPELDRVNIGVAVEAQDQPKPGAFVIFLPTELQTGTAASINAPFYGSLDRRRIDFGDRYNIWLLDRIADLVLDAVRSVIDGGGESWRGQAVVDLLGPMVETVGQGCEFLDRVLPQAHSRDGRSHFANVAIFLCDRGWRTVDRARLMPKVPEGCPVPPAQWRATAAFDIVTADLDLRRLTIEKLLARLGKTGVPSDHEWRATVETLAERVREGALGISWNDYFKSLVEVLPAAMRDALRSGKDPLRDAKILPTRDEALVSASSGVELFFEPVRGDDAADVAGGVPEILRSRLAFLHPSIQTRTERGLNTSVHRFLADRFVQTFRREEILERLVLPAVPSFPVLHDAPEAAICRALLEWGIRLVIGSKGPPSTHLRRLPVACRGGWYPMSEAAFGPGWPDGLGEQLAEVVKTLPGALRAKRSARILLPPDDMRWGANVIGHADLFASAGVARGLRPWRVKPVTLTLAGTYAQSILVSTPQGFPDALWSRWRASVKVRPAYASSFDYKLTNLAFLPELQHLNAIEPEGRRTLSDLILNSISYWPPLWREARVEKLKRKGVGESWETTLQSPLHFSLSATPWLVDSQGPPRLLCERWFVPLALLSSQPGRFAHLDPLSVPLTRRLDRQPTLLRTLLGFGLRHYPIDNQNIGPELLNALAAAWSGGRVPRTRFDIFVGQLRDAWKHLDPAQKTLPDRFVLRTAQRELEVVNRDGLAAAYLPDDDAHRRSLISHGRAIIEMQTSDVQNIAALFVETRVRRASELRERVSLDGQAYLDDIDDIGALLLDATPLAWLPILLLTVMAYGGPRPTGVGERWNQAADRLRRTRVHLCAQIGVALVDDEAVVARSEADAVWLSAGLLVIRRDVERDYERLAPAVQALLDRRDLLDVLKLVLSALPQERDPCLDDFERALGRASIDPTALADIRERWAGGMSSVLDRMRPVVALLGVEPSGLETAATDRAHLRSWFDRHLAAWPVDALFDAARRSRDDATMGRAVHDLLGEAAELPKWNAALARLGERYGSVENGDVTKQVQAHRERLALPLRALARHVALQTGDAALFKTIEDATRNVQSLPSWSTRWWVVPVTAVLEALRDAYQAASVPMVHLTALDEAIKSGELRDALGLADVPIEPDPYDIAARNVAALHKYIDFLDDLYRLWLLQSGRNEHGAPKPVPDESDPSTRLSEWSSAELIAWTLSAYGDSAFAEACAGPDTLDGVRAKLGIEPARLTNQRGERLKLAREEERRRATVSIAGAEFETDVLDVQALYERIERLSPYEGAIRDADELVELRALSVGSPPRGTTRRGIRSARTVTPGHPALKEAAGITGEIHAWRFLRQLYGDGVVTRHAWVSGIRQKVLPPIDEEEHDINDLHGFDFHFEVDRRKVLVEVKASADDMTRFELGVSQVRAAREWVGREDGEWRILRVLDVFAAQPKFEWLHNPFEPRYARFFDLGQGTMWVTYQRLTGP